jgi:hypothetical protein
MIADFPASADAPSFRMVNGGLMAKPAKGAF